MTLEELSGAYEDSYHRWVSIARRQLAKTPALKSETPEDVVQAVIKHLMEESRYLNAPSGQEFNGYMHGSIMNRIHDLVSRAVEIQAPAHEEVGYLEGMAPRPSPLDHAEATELQETIKRIIETFPPSTRRFLGLVYLEGWPQKEAAKYCGHRSMQSTCSRFRERMARELKQ